MSRILPAFLLIITISNISCTTLTPTEVSPEQIQQLLAAGNLLGPGDRVEIATSDGKVYEFRVTQIDQEAGLVLGENEQLPIKDIVAVKTREFSMGKTALLAGGVTYGLWVWMMIMIAPAIILAG